jgi:hypothetical protein
MDSVTRISGILVIQLREVLMSVINGLPQLSRICGWAAIWSITKSVAGSTQIITDSVSVSYSIHI